MRLLRNRSPEPAFSLADFSIDQLLERYRERLTYSDVLTGEHNSDRVSVTELIHQWLTDDSIVGDEHDRVLDHLVDDLVGYGPLELLLSDGEVTEIMVNGCSDVWVEVDGVLAPTEVSFRDQPHLRTVIDRLLLGTGRRLDETSPFVDARLPDGSRLNAVLPPVAVDGPLLTIRRPGQRQIDMATLVESNALSRQMAAFLHAAVVGRANILVSGGAGVGKTTLLNAIAGLVPEAQRVVVLEDVTELRIDHPHVVAQECRPGGAEGLPAVGLRELVRNSLRMRPDRLIVGEVRGLEAADMVQAMNTGHAGSMTTLHANTASDALDRLDAMLALAWPAISSDVLSRWITTAIDLIIHCERAQDGRRRIQMIAAIETQNRTESVVVPIFTASTSGFESSGRVPSRCIDKLAYHGVKLPHHLFAAA